MKVLCTRRKEPDVSVTNWPRVGFSFVRAAVTYVVLCTRPKEPTFSVTNWPRGYKSFFMLNSTEADFFPAHKY